MAQSVALLESKQYRTETQTRTNDDPDGRRKSIKSSLTTTNQEKAACMLTELSANEHRSMYQAILSGSLVLTLINLAELLFSFWPITCSVCRSLSVGVANWLVRSMSRSFSGSSRSETGESLSVEMEIKEDDSERAAELINKNFHHIYTKTEPQATSSQCTSPATTKTEPANTWPCPDRNQINISDNNSDHSHRQQVAVARLSEELSDLLIREALERAPTMTCTQPVASDLPALDMDCLLSSPEAPTLASEPSQVASTDERVIELLESQEQKEEEVAGSAATADESGIQPQSGGSSNSLEPQEPSGFSGEVELLSDQAAQLPASIAEINVENEELEESREEGLTATELASETHLKTPSDDSLPDSTITAEAKMTASVKDTDESSRDEENTANLTREQESSEAIDERKDQNKSGESIGELASTVPEEYPSSSDNPSNEAYEAGEERSDGSCDIGQPLLVAGPQAEQRELSDASDAKEAPSESLQEHRDLPEAALEHEKHVEQVNNSEQPKESKVNASSADSTFSEASSADLPQEVLVGAGKLGQSSEEESCCTSECTCDEEEFCGETASNSTLRQLKMDTFEDVLVCERNRQSLEAARRLFGKLTQGQQQQVDGSAKRAGKQMSNSDLVMAAPNRRGGSLSSGSEEAGGESDVPEEEQRASRCPVIIANNYHGNYNEEAHDTTGTGSSLNGFDTIKIVRRSGSSASSSNFRQTLVCSVSPTSQLDAGSNLDVSAPETTHPLYPIDGDEIRQCRAAFRENKRLIEEQQERALAHLEQEARAAACSSRNTNLSSGCNSPSPTNRTGSPTNVRNFRLQRDQSHLDQASKQPECSRCQKRVYPVDKMELDFTRATLNIHRNCFKCQICSTLLRLETYAALDAKLYCPSHIKCVMTGR